MHKLTGKRAIVWSGILLAVVLLVVVIVVYIPSGDDSDEADSNALRTIRYSYTLHNPRNELQQDVGFYLYLPVASSSFHAPDKVTATHPYQLTTDDHGNRVMLFQVERIPPLASEVISITTQINIKGTAVTQRLDNPDLYLGAEQYVELEAEQLLRLAAQFNHADKQRAAQQIYEWVSRNIRYQGYVSKDKGALQAYLTREGDCTEYMYLFTALARLVGIPTRNVGGFVVKEDSLLKAEAFHNWSEIYLDGKWRVVDPQNKQFLQNEADYIGMRIIADLSPTSPTLFNSHRFAVTNNQIEAKMN